MALREQARDSATEAQNRSNTGGSDNEYDGIDLTGDEFWVRLHPGTLLSGTLPEDEGNPLLKLNAYDDDAAEIDAHGNLGIVLDDPSLIVDEEEGTESTVVLETDENDSSDFRVYNPDTKGAEVIEDVGVEFDSGQGARINRGEIVDALPEDARIVVTVSGGGAQNVARRLDVVGESARYDYDAGEANDGLIEYPLYNDDGDAVDADGNPVNFSWRYARAPELKDELYGAEIALLMDWSSNMVNVDELDDDARERFEERDTDSYYYSVFNLDTGEEIEATTDGEPERYTWLEWRYDADSENRIPGDQFQFVTGYVDEADDFSEEAIREAVENNADEFDSEPETDRIVEMIQSRV